MGNPNIGNHWYRTKNSIIMYEKMMRYTCLLYVFLVYFFIFHSESISNSMNWLNIQNMFVCVWVCAFTSNAPETSEIHIFHFFYVWKNRNWFTNAERKFFVWQLYTHLKCDIFFDISVVFWQRSLLMTFIICI